MSEQLSIKVRKAGLLTSVQHPIQPHFVSFGVPMGGPMDHQAAKTANSILGNDDSTPVLEITMIGPMLYFDRSCWISLTGGDLSAQLDGEEIPLYQPLYVLANSILSFGRMRSGCRTYLGIRGRWKSSPTLLTKTLKKEETISLSVLPDLPQEIIPQPPEPIPMKPTIAIISGPEFSSLNRAYIAWFFSQEWRISPDSNRMGYRLEGDLPPDHGPKEIISSGILPGTIQVTGNGQPVILMADAQTTGGYPRIGCIGRRDLDILAQCKPGTYLRFSYTPYHDS